MENDSWSLFKAWEITGNGNLHGIIFMIELIHSSHSSGEKSQAIFFELSLMSTARWDPEAMMIYVKKDMRKPNCFPHSTILCR